MFEPRPLASAQIETSRRSGARSRGWCNALKHSLCDVQHLVLENEVRDDLEA